MSDYLFVYGTLRPGSAPAEIAPLVSLLRPVGEGFVRGRLYDLGDFPGALLDGKFESKVFGTVLSLPDHANLLPQLDRYEGFDSERLDESLFLRQLHPVEMLNGETVSAWVYVYNRPAGDARLISSGSYPAD